MAYILWQMRGGAVYVSRQSSWLLASGVLRHRTGLRNLNRGDLSYRSAAVSGSFFADRLWLRLLPTLRKENFMNIVVWKSPKALRGILRKLFRIKE